MAGEEHRQKLWESIILTCQVVSQIFQFSRLNDSYSYNAIIYNNYVPMALTMGVFQDVIST
jgi:hypothetical protein